MLDVQISELKKAQKFMYDIVSNVESAINKKDMSIYNTLTKKYKKLEEIAEKYNKDQAGRIRSGESKTRLSILFYAILGNTIMLSHQSMLIMNLFSATLDEASIYKEEASKDLK